MVASAPEGRIFSAHSGQSGELQGTSLGFLVIDNFFIIDDGIDDFFSPLDLSLPFSDIVGGIILQSAGVSSELD